MDKNMINIDELVKQRLNGGEEQERPGAWLQMRDLLDDKMPQRPVAGYNWRRMLTAATGLVLMASLTMGSYKLYTNFRQDELIAVNNKSAKNTGNFNSNPSSAKLNAPAALAETATTASHSDNNIGSANIETEVNLNSNLISGSKTPHLNKAVPEINLVASNGNVNADKSNKEQIAISANDNTSNINNNSSNLNSKNNNTSNSIDNPTASVATSNLKTPNTQEPAPVEPSTTMPVVASNETSKKSVAEDVSPMKTVKQDNTNVKDPVLLKDSIHKITVREHTKIDPIKRTAKVDKDTSSVGKMAIDKPSASNATPSSAGSSLQANQQPSAIVPASKVSPAVAEADNKSMQSLSGLKIKSQKTSAWDAQRFKEVVDNTKFRMSQVKFYPGITFGINSYLFGPNSLMGLQAGFRGTFVFNEKWSMLTELKYMQRFNQNNTVKDNYYIQSGSSVSSVEHFFKFSALHSIEMPIAVRYAFKRIHGFGGVNLAYNFKSATEEVTRTPIPEPNINWSTSITTSPSIKADDFGSRLGFGYLIGLGYEVSPAFDVEARMVHNFWDNAKGIGARNISQQLYRMPSFQISLGYRFSQQNKIPKAK